MTVDPGASARVRLRLRNTGDVVDEYRFEPVGSVSPWTAVEPQTLRLAPGTTGTVELTFTPPRTPDASAGPHPYAIRITPTGQSEAVAVPEGGLTITPFTEIRAELVPPTVKGRFAGRPRLAIDNLGNTELTLSVVGEDSGQLACDIHPGDVRIEPGRAAFVKATLTPREIIWFGPKERRPYTLTVQRSGENPLPVEGMYIQRGFLPRSLASVLGTLTALALTFAVLWVAYKPQIKSLATEKVQDAGVSTVVPGPSAPPRPSPAPSAKSKPTPKPTPAAGKEGGGKSGGGKDGDGKSGGGGNGATTTVTAGSPNDTAATALRRLSSNDPSGHHICYRVFVVGSGWQTPVCDGTVAGSVGNQRIQAINFAANDAKGLLANAMVHTSHSTDGHGVAEPQWTSIIPDGEDLYVGSTKSDAPYMLGFILAVESGRTCQTSHVHGEGWHNQQCLQADPDFNFGGTSDNSHWLDAFKLTV